MENKIAISFDDELDGIDRRIYMTVTYGDSSIKGEIYLTDFADDVGPTSFFRAIKEWPENKKNYLARPDRFKGHINKSIKEKYEKIEEKYKNIERLEFVKEENEFYIVGGGWKLKFPDNGNVYLEVIQEGKNLQDVFFFLKAVLIGPWL